MSCADERHFENQLYRGTMRRIGSTLRRHNLEQKVWLASLSSVPPDDSFRQIVDAFAAVRHITKLTRLAGLERLSCDDLIRGEPCPLCSAAF